MMARNEKKKTTIVSLKDTEKKTRELIGRIIDTKNDITLY